MFCHKLLVRFPHSVCKTLTGKLAPIQTCVAVLRAQPTAFFYTSFQHRTKIFVDGENKYAHDVLLNSLKPYQLFRPDADLTVNGGVTSSLSDTIIDPPSIPELAYNCVDQVHSDFRDLMLFCNRTHTCISNERFGKFVKLFCQVCPKLSDDQLLECIAYFAILPQTLSVNVKNFYELWSTFDMECNARLDSWNTDRLLMVCDAWYALNLARLCTFVWNALRRMGRRVRKMTPEQLVHSMFFCNIVRKPLSEMFDYEVNFDNVIDKMSLQEIGVMSMGFFKTQTPIRNPVLIEKIYRRLTDEVQSVEDITLVSILKILRYSTKLPQVDLMTELLVKLCPQIERVSLLSCLHIALLGCDVQHCHDPAVDLIVARFNLELDNARLKDMERICHVISLFNYKSAAGVETELGAKILEKLKTKVDEIINYPRCFANCLHYLSIKGHYDEDMISTVLDTKFIHHTYGKNIRTARELFSLDSFVKIKLKDTYKGNQLKEQHRRSMGKLLTHYIPDRNGRFKLAVTDRVLVDVKETTDRIFRTDMNFLKHILPHFQRPDIVVCYDRTTRKPVALSADCPEDYTGVILDRDQLLGDIENATNIDTIAIVVSGWNNIVRGKDRYTGAFQMKLDQLALLGHKPVVINWYEWRELETPKDRYDFIKRRLAL